MHINGLSDANYSKALDGRTVAPGMAAKIERTVLADNINNDTHLTVVN